MRVLLLAALVLLGGCAERGGGGGGPIPMGGSPTLMPRGIVATGVAPSGGAAIGVWVVSSGSPDYAYKFGEGTATGTSFDVDFPAAPPAAAINAGVLGVGVIAVLSPGPSLPDGMIDEATFDSRIIGLTSQHAVIWRPEMFPVDAPIREDHWITGFAPGYSCGECVPSIDCELDTDCPTGVTCDMETFTCGGGSSFDRFVPVDCAEMQIDSADARVCNWT